MICEQGLSFLSCQWKKDRLIACTASTIRPEIQGQINESRLAYTASTRRLEIKVRSVNQGLPILPVLDAYRSRSDQCNSDGRWFSTEKRFQSGGCDFIGGSCSALSIQLCCQDSNSCCQDINSSYNGRPEIFHTST